MRGMSFSVRVPAILSFLLAAAAASVIGSCDYVPSEDLIVSRRIEAARAWQNDVEQWRARRLASLQKEDGWLTLIGLEWIEKGSNRIGSSVNNEVVIRSESVPKWLGVIVVDEMPAVTETGSTHARARFVPKLGGVVFHEGRPVVEPVNLRTDQQDDTTILTSGTTQFHLIERGDRLAVRIKDARSPALIGFEGLEYYPFDPAWRIEGRFIPHDEMMSIGDVTGFVQEIPSPGMIELTIDGQNYSLIALEGGSDSYFVIFADRTNGLETYGAGRYLYTGLEDADGDIVIDFNQSYNPPCVFTDFATCPLPPRQNRLPIPVRAGEKMYAAGHQVEASGEM